MSGIGKFRGKFILGLVLGVLVYLTLIIYSGWEQVLEAFAEFPWIYAPVILALTLLNYFLRFKKWDYYLGVLDVKCSRTDSLVVFFSGLTMTISPGKIGELLKSYFLNKCAGVEVSRTMPVVVAERLTDFLALVIISLSGIGFLATGSYNIIILAAIFLLSFIFLIANRRISLFFIGHLEKLPVISPFAGKIHVMYDSMASLLRLTPLLVATVWSLAAWMCECTGMYIVARLLGGGADILAASFIYAFGTIAGSISPGGLGVTDGSLLAMLQNSTMMNGDPLSKAGAGAATLIIRMATLWFAVFVGAIVLMLNSKRFSGVEEFFDDPETSENSAGD